MRILYWALFAELGVLKEKDALVWRTGCCDAHHRNENGTFHVKSFANAAFDILEELNAMRWKIMRVPADSNQLTVTGLFFLTHVLEHEAKLGGTEHQCSSGMQR